MIDDDIRRYTAVLDELIGRSRLTKADVEQRLHWAKGRLTKLLQGTYELKVRHVLSVLEAINVQPLHFYALVHRSADSGRGNSLAESLIAAFEAQGAKPLPLLLPAMLTAEELDARIEKAVRQALDRAGRK
ncbi:MAG TPA: hypothetical protein VKK31_08555 [Thermoanaerobaculia bacterium]|nr:hypothetical protein [Thermoanaerobaculia bacterium]